MTPSRIGVGSHDMLSRIIFNGYFSYSFIRQLIFTHIYGCRSIHARLSATIRKYSPDHYMYAIIFMFYTKKKLTGSKNIDPMTTRSTQPHAKTK